MEIIELRSKKTWAGPGIDAFDAEIKCFDEEKNAYSFVHYNACDGEHFTVAPFSIYDYMTGASKENPEGEFEEEYENLLEAMNSRFIDCFILLSRTVDGIADITYGFKETAYKNIVSEIDVTDNSEEIEDNEPAIIIADFDVKGSVSDEIQHRQIKIEWDYENDTYKYELYDETNNLIEQFDDIEATTKSKWSLLYAELNHKLDEVF